MSPTQIIEKFRRRKSMVAIEKASKFVEHKQLTDYLDSPAKSTSLDSVISSFYSFRKFFFRACESPSLSGKAYILFWTSG